MTWRMSAEELANVAKLAPKARYEYFVEKVADYQEVWGLWNNRWALLGDNEQNALLPVWPHPDLATACANEQWVE